MLRLTNFIGFGVGGSASSNPLAGSTWNPADMFAGTLVLGDSNLSANNPLSNTYQAVRGTVSISTGIGKYEVKVLGLSGFSYGWAFGIGLSTAALDDANYGVGHALRTGTKGIGGLGNFAVNDYIGFVIDMVALSLRIYRNGSLFTTITIPAGTWYPMCSSVGNGKGLMNFSEDTFVYPIS